MHNILKGKKVIFFDVGYTLDYPASGDWMIINKLKELAGDRLSSISPDAIQEALKRGYQYLETPHLIKTIDEECENLYHYYSILSETLGLGLTRDELVAVAQDRARNMDNYILYPDAKHVLEVLSKTYCLGIISDTWPSIELQLDKFGIRQYFSFFTYSFQLGVFKPDPKMFTDALGKCGCSAEETVFIDDVQKNVEGAALSGITPILIATNPVSDVEVPYTKIHSLSDLIIRQYCNIHTK